MSVVLDLLAVDGWYDSRRTRSPGIGYPSCSQEIARRPPNTADPQGYYAELGVDPAASPEQIRAAIRRRYFELHPDTAEDPDPDLLQRVTLIAEVLLDPVSREAYNRTPRGQRLLDAVYAAELSRLDELHEMDADEVVEMLAPRKTRTARPGRYDYLAIRHTYHDGLKAQLWYHNLLVAAPVVGYRRRIKVLIHDGPAYFDVATETMLIPRDWEPSSALAFALFTAVAGINPAVSHRSVTTVV